MATSELVFCVDPGKKAKPRFFADQAKADNYHDGLARRGIRAGLSVWEKEEVLRPKPANQTARWSSTMTVIRKSKPPGWAESPGHVALLSRALHDLRESEGTVRNSVEKRVLKNFRQPPKKCRSNDSR